MHHTERRKASNTGRLAALSLEGSEIRLRGMAKGDARTPLPEGRRLVLFPSPTARVLSREDHGADDVVLLVPDGNWGQAFRAARRDPDLLGAEHVVLPPGPPTRYALRRGTLPGRVCTIEAIARALGILEGPEIQAALERVLDRFVERTLLFNGNLAALDRLRSD
jgi:DTW domain-containing protein YfiP